MGTMWRREATLCVFLTGALGAACSDAADSSGPAATLMAPTAATATVRFDLSAESPAFADVPFPSEIYRDRDGRIALGTLPNPLDGSPMFTALRGLLADRSGFCTTCNATFAIDGPFDQNSLPSEAALSVGPDFTDGVALVNVDPASPNYGTRLPLRVQWDSDRGWLQLRPARGAILEAGRRYAAVLTTSLKAGDGTPLQAAPTFLSMHQGGENEAEVRARDALAFALEALEDLGLPGDQLAGVAAFTTDDPTRGLLALRTAVHAAPRSDAEVHAVWSGGALDELLGVPAVDGPGVDQMPAAATAGTRAISHATTAIVVAGAFPAPRFVEGEGAEVGALLRADAGSPISEIAEPVPFVLIVPTGADLQHLPVVLAHHGFNASRTTGFALTDTVGRVGYALLAIDAFQHGARAASARDEVHAMRGDMSGPDGFAETSDLDVSGRVFGLLGGADTMKLFAGYPLAAFSQFAADSMTAVRLLREGGWESVRAADPMLAELAFDPDRIVFVGNSMGAVVGASLLTVEPDISAAVLNVMPGSIIETLAESGEFRTLSTTLLLPQMGVTDTFDEVESAMVFDPTVDLVRWVLEPVDPLALAPFWLKDRRIAGAPDVLVQLAGHDEVAAPPASEAVVAAAGIAGDGDFAFAQVPHLSLPWRGEDATVGAVRFEGAMHGMLEVHEQSSRFQGPLLPPLEDRLNATVLVNPIDDVHAQIETFLRTLADDGRATIAR